MMDDREAAAYLAGLFDGEGHISHYKCAQGHFTRSISFCNTDKALVDFAIGLLCQLGFQTRVQFDHKTHEHWSDRWNVYIAGGRRAFEKFRELVPIKSPNKIATLNTLLNTYAQHRGKIPVGETRPCETCGNPVYACQAEIARGGGRFCSHECRGKSQRTRFEKSCETCGSNFMVTPYRSKQYGRFCSRSCAGKSKADRMRALASIAANARWKRRSSSQTAIALA